MAIRKKQEGQAPVPRHIAIIMDGNGRWAKKRLLPRTAGHAAGAETFRKIALYCREIGVEYLTVYAFSTENWKRPQEEVSRIMSLMRDYLLEAIRDMQKNHVRIRFFGDLTALSPQLQELAKEAERESEVYADSQVNLCINYGSRGLGQTVPGDGGGPGFADGGGFFVPFVFCRRAGPGSHHPARRRAADLQFPAVAGGLCRAVFHRRALAGF